MAAKERRSTNVGCIVAPYARFPSAKGNTGTLAVASDRGNAVHIAADGAWIPLSQYDTDSAGNATGLVGPDGGTVNLQLSSRLKACIPARDIATRFNDITSNAANLVVEGGNTGAFSTEGYFNTTAAANGGLNIPQSKIAWNPSSESMVLSFVVKRAAPVGNENILSIGATVANYQGFYLSHRATSGKIRIVPILNNGSLASGTADSTLSFSDATPRDRAVTVAYDAPTGSWYLYRDGVLSDSYVGVTAPGGANAFANAVSLAELRVGALGVITGNAAVVVLGYGLQFSKWTGSLPTNIGQIAARLAETPRIPVAFGEI